MSDCHCCGAKTLRLNMAWTGAHLSGYRDCLNAAEIDYTVAKKLATKRKACLLG